MNNEVTLHVNDKIKFKCEIEIQLVLKKIEGNS